MTDTCINYQTILPPTRGEHLAMGDTGVVIYSNSVFGARSNFEGGPSALAAALTGRTPRYGYHLDAHRRATRRFQLDVRLHDLSEWGALGGMIGRDCGSYWEVPLIEGIENAPGSDALKHFGAAMASYGSTALFHMPGITPEPIEFAGSVPDTVRIGRAELDAFVTAYGATGSEPPPPRTQGAARRAVTALRDASRTGTFWLLAGAFAICGATTNGLIGTHFIPAAHDHGMPQTTAAGLLALVGAFDIVGTIASGWLTDRYDSRLLLAMYYGLRGLSLLVLPSLLAASLHPNMLVFILFYGLDWIATVPPTIALCRERFGDAGPVVFGWVFASHQIGAALAASGAGVIHDRLGAYDTAFYVAGGLALIAAVLSVGIRRSTVQWRVAFEEP